MKCQVNIAETNRLTPLTATSSEWRDTEIVKPVIENLSSINRQFVKINVSTIINLNYVDVFNFDEHFNNVIICGEIHVTRYFLLRVIVGFQTIKSKDVSNKQNLSTVTLKSTYRQKYSVGSYLTSDSNSHKLDKVDYSNIYHLTRRGSLTTVHFIDGTKTSFYGSLVFFEEKLSSAATFIRIRHDCIINLNYTGYIKFNDKTKSGKIKVGSFSLTISR